MAEDNASISADENIDRTVGIVSAFVSNNSVAQGDLSALIATVHQALGKLTAPEPAEEVRPVPAVPGLSARCSRASSPPLEDGLQFKSLKRHLRTRYDLTPDQYRARWGLPADYPMVAPNYAAARSGCRSRAASARCGRRRRRPRLRRPRRRRLRRAAGAGIVEVRVRTRAEARPGNAAQWTTRRPGSGARPLARTQGGERFLRPCLRPPRHPPHGRCGARAGAQRCAGPRARHPGRAGGDRARAVRPRLRTY